MKQRRAWFTDYYLLWLVSVAMIALVWPKTLLWFHGQWVVGALMTVMLGTLPRSLTSTTP